MAGSVVVVVVVFIEVFVSLMSVESSDSFCSSVWSSSFLGCGGGAMGLLPLLSSASSSLLTLPVVSAREAFLLAALYRFLAFLPFLLRGVVLFLADFGVCCCCCCSASFEDSTFLMLSWEGVGEGTGDMDGDELADGFFLLLFLLFLAFVDLPDEVLERLLPCFLFLLLPMEEVLLDWVIDSSSSASAALTFIGKNE